MSNFKAGDAVALNSGGPVMTVRKIYLTSKGDLARCEWFSGLDIKSHDFMLASLRTPTPADKYRSTVTP